MVRIGLSTDTDGEGGVPHFIGDGVAGAGGRVAGARRDFVGMNTAGGRWGGMRKCNFSSLE
jgi:hypothetical protein